MVLENFQATVTYCIFTQAGKFNGSLSEGPKALPNKGLWPLNWAKGHKKP